MFAVFPKIILIIRNEKTNKKYLLHILHLIKKENFYLNNFYERLFDSM